MNILIAILLILTISNAIAEDSLENWEKCERAAISAFEKELKKRQQKCEAEGKSYLCWIPGNSEQTYYVRDKCGSKPRVNGLPKDVEEYIADYCTEVKDLNSLPQSGVRLFASYGGKGSDVFRRASIECRKRYAPFAEQHEQARLERIKAEQDFSIQRVFEPAEGYVTVLLNTSRTRNVKCVLYQSAGKPIAVQESVVTPPVDEVIISLGNYTGNVNKRLTSCSVMP